MRGTHWCAMPLRRIRVLFPTVKQDPRRPNRGAFSLVASIILLIALAATNSSAQGDVQSYFPSAYGTYAFAGNAILVDRTAPVSLAGNCGTSYEPLNASGVAAGVNLAPLVVAGAVNTSASDDFHTSQAQSTTTSISLLGGLISGQQINAASTTAINENGSLEVSSAGSTFGSLIVLGK